MLRAGTSGATPRSRLIDQRDVRVLRLYVRLVRLIKPPNYSETPAGTDAAGCPRNLGFKQSTGFAQGTLFSSQGALLSSSPDPPAHSGLDGSRGAKNR